MVLCFENYFGLLWEKIVQKIKKQFCEFEAKDQEFANSLRLLDQFIWKVKGQNIFCQIAAD